MNLVNVKIISAGDPAPFECEGDLHLFDIHHAAIIEKGTSCGKTSIAFIAEEGEDHFVFQMTAAMFNMIKSVLDGAEMRFKNSIHDPSKN